MRDPYRTLGVRRRDDIRTIKAAYRRLAKEHHPDRNPGDVAADVRFREVTEAFELLNDPQERAYFDRTVPNIPDLGRVADQCRSILEGYFGLRGRGA